ncbi:MAG: phosphoglycerate kinase, partial [Thermomicrobia bacterium]|nr:phosphoglycerate kinase [Thermomicrobia bacterium]
IAPVLAEQLGRPVRFVPACVGEEAEAAVRAAKPGDVLLMENLRFHAEEEANDPAFAAQLATLGDLFVNDAFGTAHRAHASTEGIAHLLPAYAGLLMEKELDALGGLLAGAKRPFIVVLGGAKISDKIGVIENLMGKVDGFCIGGGMANTFLLAQNYDVGRSLVEQGAVATAHDILARTSTRRVGLHVPTDAIVSSQTAKELLSDDAPEPVTRTVRIDELGPDDAIYDIGPKTASYYSSVVKGARTVFWNGPMGMFEVPAFAHGTITLAHAVADASAKGTMSVVGGGDSVAAIEEAGVAERITHISTGGGASLEFLEGKTLPGVEALRGRTED